MGEEGARRELRVSIKREREGPSIKWNYRKGMGKKSEVIILVYECLEESGDVEN